MHAALGALTVGGTAPGVRSPGAGTKREPGEARRRAPHCVDRTLFQRRQAKAYIWLRPYRETVAAPPFAASASFRSRFVSHARRAAKERCCRFVSLANAGFPNAGRFEAVDSVFDNWLQQSINRLSEKNGEPLQLFVSQVPLEPLEAAQLRGTDSDSLRYGIQSLAPAVPEELCAPNSQAYSPFHWLCHLTITNYSGALPLVKAQRGNFAAILPVNPMERTPRPEPDDKAPRHATLEQLRALIATCKGRSFHDRRDAALIAFMFDTGWRVSSVLSVTVDQILHDGPLEAPAKGRRRVIARIQPPTRAALDRYLRVRRSAHAALWLTRRDRPMDRHDVYDVFDSRSRRAFGLDRSAYVHPHMLRHAHAHYWLSAGGNLVDLMENLGHSSIRVTERYLRALGRERAMEARDKYSPGNLL